jgi:hypothetical protein
VLVCLAPALTTGCYSSSDGTPPPTNALYFPTGLAVSTGGNVLYVINSDFDLQWNGGTLQSFNLFQMRHDTVVTINDPNDPNLPLVNPPTPQGSCPYNPPLYDPGGTGSRQHLGETCSPQMQSQYYEEDSAIIGAFATDLQLSGCSEIPSVLNPSAYPTCPTQTDATVQRLFAPVRGNTSLTWAQVVWDDPTSKPEPNTPFAPFNLDCGVRVDDRCDTGHEAGVNPYEPGNNRYLTLPGEPFGMAQSEDGTVIAITHQTETQTSLLASGFDAQGNVILTPSMQFVLNGVDNGGNGIVVVPHDPDAFPDCGMPAQGGVTPPCPPQPAFLQTSRDIAKVDLLRYYSDQDGENSSSYLRPFLVEERSFPITTNSGGSDSRGIAIDPTPRIACKNQISATDPEYRAKIAACAQLPARVFIANRAPPTLILAEIGENSAAEGIYDADQLVFLGNVPLSPGPSRVYVAPIVDANGNYAVRVFVVCFDSNDIYVYDPDAEAIEAVIQVAPGPFALAFDPFSIEDVALRRPVLVDSRDPEPVLNESLLVYRFAYIASFTNSYMQIIDLDNSRPDKSTFEQVVFTLGSPQIPKGSEGSQ